MNDLIVLVADKDAEFTLKGLLNRHHALRIRDISSTTRIFSHENRDNGCYASSHEFLRPFSSRYSHALVMFDHHGSGHEQTPRDVIETDIEQRLAANGWLNRSAVIVISPELENWLWTPSLHVEEVLGWRGATPDLYSWMREKKYLDETSNKPTDPKETLHKALRQSTKRASSSLFGEIARKVHFQNCRDTSFQKLVSTLQQWFGVQHEPHGRQ